MAASLAVRMGKGAPYLLYRHIPKLGMVPAPQPTGDVLTLMGDRACHGPFDLGAA